MEQPELANEYRTGPQVKDDPAGIQIGRFKFTRPNLKEHGKPAFWTIGAAFSLLLNVILIVVLLVVARQMFAIKSLVNDHLVGGLYYNFILMDQATIVTEIEVNDTIPVQFDLHLQNNTNVVLTEAAYIQGAAVTLRTGGLNIVQAPTDIVLPAGTVLPVALDMVVPVDATIPIHLEVPVNIPLKDTELHAPFVGLQEVIAPLYWLLAPLPGSWHDVACLTPFAWNCPE